MTTVLIADDEDAIRGGIHFVLRRYKGYDVLEARDGKECMEIIKEKKVDLVILDLRIPIIDGYRLLELIRKIEVYKDTPILVYSAYIMDEQDSVLMNQATRVLRKPFDIAKLVDLISVFTQ